MSKKWLFGPKFKLKDIAKTFFYSFIGFDLFVFALSYFVAPSTTFLDKQIAASFDGLSLGVISTIVYFIFVMQDKKTYKNIKGPLEHLKSFDLNSNKWFLTTDCKKVEKVESDKEIIYTFYLKTKDGHLKFLTSTFDKETKKVGFVWDSFFEKYYSSETKSISRKIEELVLKESYSLSRNDTLNYNDFSDSILLPFDEALLLIQEIKEVKHRIQPNHIEEHHEVEYVEKELKKLSDTYSQLSDTNKQMHKDKCLEIIELLRKQIYATRDTYESAKMKDFEAQYQRLTQNY